MISTIAWLALVCASLAACATGPRPITGRPPIPPGVPQEHLHFADAVVAQGQLAPDFDLPTAARDRRIRLSSFRGRPLVLVFGSHTCNVFARDAAALRRLHADVRGDADFLLVYVREAHASDEWVMPANEAKGLRVTQPKTAEDRASAALECVAELRLDMPTVVDELDDAVSKTYGGWPDRLYVVAPDGRIAYQGGVGPFGFKPDEVREFLRATYGF